MNYKNILLVTGGAIVGAVIAYKFTSDASKKMIESEVEAVCDYWKGVIAKYTEEDDEETEQDISVEAEPTTRKPGVVIQPSIEELMAQNENNGYVNYATSSPKEKRAKKIDEKEIEEALSVLPHIITPGEFASADIEFDTVEYKWYEGDGTLLNEQEEVIDAMSTLGIDPADHFDMYDGDPDTIYMRNDVTKLDFEILRVAGNYEDN